MAKLAIWAEVQAKPGKEKEVEGFLKSAQPLAEREGGTLTWYKSDREGMGFSIRLPTKKAGKRT
jgi:hypothetical protein